MDNRSSRYFCSILDDMRSCCKTGNYSYLLGLIEEAQYRAERTEKALEDAGEFQHIEDYRVKLKDEIRELKKKKAEAGNKCPNPDCFHGNVITKRGSIGIGAELGKCPICRGHGQNPDRNIGEGLPYER